MIRYYLHSIYLSLYSRLFYAGLFHNKRASGVRYLLLLSFMISVPLAFELKVLINKAFFNSADAEENVQYIVNQLPEIDIKKDKISTPLSQNQSIISKSGNTVAIIDVENKINDINEYSGILIIDSDGLKMKMPNSETVFIVAAEDLAISLDKYFATKADGSRQFLTADFLRDTEQVLQTPFIMILVFFTILFSIRYILSAVIYSLVAMIFAVIIVKPRRAEFSQYYRIAAFTTTPAALLEMLSYMTLGSIFIHASLIYFIAHLLYIHFAIESYKKFLSPLNFGKIV